MMYLRILLVLLAHTTSSTDLEGGTVEVTSRQVASIDKIVRQTVEVTSRQVASIDKIVRQTDDAEKSSKSQKQLYKNNNVNILRNIAPSLEISISTAVNRSKKFLKGTAQKPKHVRFDPSNKRARINGIKFVKSKFVKSITASIKHFNFQIFRGTPRDAVTRKLPMQMSSKKTKFCEYDSVYHLSLQRSRFLEGVVDRKIFFLKMAPSGYHKNQVSGMYEKPQSGSRKNRKKMIFNQPICPCLGLNELELITAKHSFFRSCVSQVQHTGEKLKSFKHSDSLSTYASQFDDTHIDPYHTRLLTRKLLSSKVMGDGHVKIINTSGVITQNENLKQRKSNFTFIDTVETSINCTSISSLNKSSDICNTTLNKNTDMSLRTTEDLGFLDPLKTSRATLDTNQTSNIFNRSVDSQPTGQNKTPDSDRPIWTTGLLDYKTAVSIVTYFRLFIPIPCVISLGSGVLCVRVIGAKSFIYVGKELVIAFNVFEGIKCCIFLLHRTFKLHYRDSMLTWRSPYSIFFVYVFMWIPDVIGRISIVLNLVSTVTRHFAIAYPLKMFHNRVSASPKLVIIPIVICAFLYQTFPLILFFGYIEPRLNYSQTFRTDDLVSTMIAVDPEVGQMYVKLFTVGATIFRYIPTFLIIVFNVLTCISLHRLGKKRQKLFNTEHSRTSTGRSVGAMARVFTSKTNFMLVGSSIIFAFVVSLKPLNRSLQIFFPDYGEGGRNLYIYMITNDLFLLLDNTVPTINLIVYCAVNSAFRTRIKELFLCRK